MTALTASQTTPLVSQTSASAPAPATTFAAIWNYLPAPSSLNASIIASTSLVQGTNTHPVVHYALDCPAADSPANNFCRDLGQYPEEVRYTYGATSSHV